MHCEGILDTNPFLGYLHDGTEKDREKFGKLIERALQSETVFFIPSIVVIEMVYVLERVYGLSKAQVREIVESLLSLPVKIENLDVFLKALALYGKKNLKFEFNGDFWKFSEARVL